MGSKRRIGLRLDSLERRMMLSVAVDLQAASDTGILNDDNITADTTPTFDVTVDAAGTIDIDWEDDAAVDLSAPVGAAGTYQFTPAAPLADGVYPVAVTFGAESAGLPTTIDTQALVVTDDNIAAVISVDAGDTDVAEILDVITVTWDNSATGDNNDDVASVSVDLSAFGGPGACAAGGPCSPQADR